MLLNGQLISGSEFIDIINPADESVVAKCPVANEAMLDDTVAGANTAFLSWKNTSFAHRADKLNELIAAIEANAEEFAVILTKEQGKPITAAREEVMFAQMFAQHFTSQELRDEVLLENDDQKVQMLRRPLGVVASICPWNFPLLITLYKLAPAIMMGNTVIVKPAPSTPLSSLKLGELINDIFPAGVINIITDNNDLGPLISAHPGIAKISFTGSTPTGKKIMATAAGTLKRLTLELGGNDAAIVLDDADPSAIAAGIFGSAFINSGQVCIALKRLYVHASIYDSLCEELAKLALNAKVGNGMDESTEFGPVQNKAQYEKVCGYINSAKQFGNIIAGGNIPDGPGYFIPLTLVRDIDDGCAVVDEEPFGPILPIIKYHDVDDAIARANNSMYALGASVWSSNYDRAFDVAKKLSAGTVWINQHCAFGPHIPFPPAKESGIGVEWGKEGLQEYTAMQVININKV
jgi:acyl-CoA reductase-like NAD-dependent aldehyde dehydrogenase